jgi:imidazolonepropionase-like amidohydrolase
MGSEAIRNVLEAGVDILHHGTYLDEALAARMVEAGTYFCPTASAYQRQTMNPLFERGGPWADAHDALVAPHAKSLRIAVAAGVQIVNGTDSTGWYAEDVAMLRSAGMDPMNSLLACTAVPAAALGLSTQLGTIEQGKTADLVVLGADPLADPYALDHVRTVIAGGAVHDPATLGIETSRSTRFVDHPSHSTPIREEQT